MITETVQRRRCNVRQIAFSCITVTLTVGFLVEIRHGTFQHLDFLLWIDRRYYHHRRNGTDLTEGTRNSTNTTGPPQMQYYVSQWSGNFDNRRLGNQLFNFAAALYVTKRSNERQNLPPSDYQNGTTILRADRVMAMPLHHPHGWLEQWFDVKVARYENHKDGINAGICPCAVIGEERGLAFSSSIDSKIAEFQKKSPPVRSILLSGWFQSWKYTVGVEIELRRHLQFTKNISKKVDEFFEEMRPCRFKSAHCSGLRKFTRVGVHVRRADILNPDKVSYGYTVPDRHYLKKAMQYFVNSSELLQFIVVSDDIKWSKDAIRENGPITDHTDVVYSSPDAPAAVDLAILSRCDGVIMTTGTFGWWGAWLANKTTIYYKDWPRAGTTLMNLFNREEFFPPHWIPMS